MSKSDPIETALNELGEVRSLAPEVAVGELRRYLRNRSNLVVAKAAKLSAELQAKELMPDLTQAFDRFMADPHKLDKRCAAMTEIAGALYELDCPNPEVYLRGLRHVQKEASYGPPVDMAAALRGICSQGLSRTNHRTAVQDVLPLLVDPEVPARLGAVRALSTNGGDAGALLVRLKVLTGDDAAEVIGECFSGLLSADPGQSLPFVSQYADDDDDAIAEAAIWALGESRLPAAFEVLKAKWERTVHREQRKILLAALAACRLEESVNFLMTVLETAGAQTALEVIAALEPYRSNEKIRIAIAGIVDQRNVAALRNAFRDHFPS